MDSKDQGCCRLDEAFIHGKDCAPGKATTPNSLSLKERMRRMGEESEEEQEQPPPCSRKRAKMTPLEEPEDKKLINQHHVHPAPD
ncbi:hypothetical protein NQZ68_024323 [Dissostichus eleginoides]|nr:hypothetical protein NQZ68_024323 [Dissostichus eleginoides]